MVSVLRHFRLWLCPLLLLGGCGQQEAPPPPLALQTPETSHPIPPVRQQLFAEVAEESGLNFRHIAGRSLSYRFFEIVGSGAALFDYDGDGDLDVYLVQGHRWTDSPAGPVPQTPVPSDRLFRNDSAAGDPDSPLVFTDVTEISGLAGAIGYGQGVTCGDYDNDGDVDLYVTNFGSNQLWNNNGDATFTEVALVSGTDAPQWSTSAAFVDYDRDGWLDLYVCNYVNYAFATHKPCYGANGSLDYCGPNSFDPEPDQLFRNNGNGTFTDVSADVGIAAEYGAGLGVVCADFNNDRLPDIYVANDGMANRLWIGRADGTFEDTALVCGCAYNGMGSPEAGMGVDAADCDHDGDEDLFMVHLTNETNTLYLNDGSGSFSDRTNLAQLGAHSQPMTGFGTGWFDYDNDSWLDLVVANGTVKRENSAIADADPFPRGQRNQLFRNEAGRFRDVSRDVHPAFDLEEMSRGLAFGDIDNDGDIDLLVVNNDGPVRLFRNQTGHQRPWLGLRLVDRQGLRDQTGALVDVQLAGGSTLRRRVRRDGSYCSSHDARLSIGLPEGEQITRLRITWPDGDIEHFAVPPLSEYHQLQQGTGQKANP